MQMLLARITVFSAALVCTRCQQQLLAKHVDDDVAGYMYTSLNGEGENQVISFARAANGSLLSQVAFGTGSPGGANRSALGGFLGGFDAQESMQIIEDSLLVVNAGGNTISVFELNRATGDLVLTRNYASRGIRPVSIAVQPNARREGLYWVVVGNQLSNPNVQLGGTGQPPIEFFPDKEFIVKGRFFVDPNRNVFLFTFDVKTRILKPVRRIDAYVGTNGGPACVAFSPDGRKLAVSTWGIAHIATPPAEIGQFQQPSRVYVYDFSPYTGRTSGKRFFEEPGVAGTTGFSWNRGRGGGQDLLYVSNFNLVADKIDFAVTVLDASPQAWRYGYGGRRIPLVQNLGTGPPGASAANCWTFVSRDGRVLWVTGTGPNIISIFRIDPDDGRLGIVGPGPLTAFVQRPPGTPPADSKDLWQSPDGESLYMLGSFASFEVAQFDVDIDGPSLSFVTQTAVPVAQPQERGAFNFLGLVGFDLSHRYGPR